ncbi:Maf family protein [Quisquiliibacterium transsilvanicum]|uniref:dTTP/UTP pyrophosphatase n=1 Tax=Quisquiliibacterium transsilvanicum TaxID=1549638 RepID=A0A7W8HIH5_9BURK|nr:Maf family protein [Quisquiliibacterium transsilvanicum]MBB5272001.1 septum formation protein [Quisquiliibacterium transsilvanicum]
MTDFVYLASKSPRRQELLRQIGVRFRVLEPLDPEAAEALEAPLPSESPTVYVGRVVRAKLESALASLAPRGLEAAPVLAADTTVAVGGRMLGKPATAAEAREMLRLLSGRSHRVLTAVALARSSRREVVVNVSRVSFARLSTAEIDDYVASGEPFDKAGAYGIQGAAGAFARRIEGSYSGIMGLPLYETARLLRGLPGVRNPEHAGAPQCR